MSGTTGELTVHHATMCAPWQGSTVEVVRPAHIVDDPGLISVKPVRATPSFDRSRTRPIVCGHGMHVAGRDRQFLGIGGVS